MLWSIDSRYAMVCYSTFNSRAVFGLHVVSIGYRRHFHQCARPWYSVILERFTSLCEPWIGTRRSVCFVGVNTIWTEAGYLVVASINVPPYLCGIELNIRIYSSILRIREKIERRIRERKRREKRKTEDRNRSLSYLYVHTVKCKLEDEFVVGLVNDCSNRQTVGFDWKLDLTIQGVLVTVAM